MSLDFFRVFLEKTRIFFVLTRVNRGISRVTTRIFWLPVASGTFLVRCYSRRRILASVCTKTGFHLMDENTPLNVELRPCIESHFKCTIMNVKIVFRLGFGVKIQNLPGARCNQLMWFLALQRRKCTTKFEISWMHRSA